MQDFLVNFVSALKDVLLLLFWTIFVFAIGIYYGCKYAESQIKRKSNVIDSDDKGENTNGTDTE